MAHQRRVPLRVTSRKIQPHRAAGQVLSRDQILNHVWEYDYDAASNVVEIYVHYLRNKIDGPFSPKLIQTVRGVGYSLRLEGGQK